MFLGMDASTQLEVNRKNPKYTYKGKEVEPWQFLFEHNNLSWMRLRIWVDPYDKDGHPYGGGTNDLKTTIELGKKANQIGYKVLLNFHYSDFWADPNKQFIPKAWQHLNEEELVQKIYDYTYETLLTLKEAGVVISAVQVGNEITNGTLWPFGKLPRYQTGLPREYTNLLKMLKAGTSAVKAADPSLLRVIHLEDSSNKVVYQQYFDEVSKAGIEYEVIGLSYYPYWHGTLSMLFDNIDNLINRYDKKIWIVETGSGFTLEPYILNGNKGVNLVNEEMMEKDNIRITYPLTLEGQRQFTADLLSNSKKHNVEAIFWWEPLWLPLLGLQWASLEGEKYVQETHKPTNNEWANQCLFDYQGEATPALDEYHP